MHNDYTEFDVLEQHAAELDALKQHAAELDASEQHAAELDALEQHTAELDASEQHAAESNAPEPHSHAQNASEPHSHAHNSGPHSHSHTQTQAVLNRMARAIGHMEAVKRMVEDGRDCSEVLIQIAAVRSAINNIGKIILEDHISHCIVDAVEHGDQQALEDLKTAIEKFIK